MKNLRGFEGFARRHGIASQVVESSQAQRALDKELGDAAYAGNLEQCKNCLDAGANINLRDPYTNMKTPLYLAVEQRREDVVEYLLSRGADPNIPDGMWWSPLGYAVAGNFVGIARLLLDAGADVEVLKMGFYETPLKRAVEQTWFRDIRGEEQRKNYFKMIKLLVSHGANLEGTFDALLQAVEFFDGDASWIPEGPMKAQLQRIGKTKRLFRR